MISSVGIARAGTSSRYLLGGGSGFVHLTYAPLCGHRKSPQSNRRYFTLFATPTEEQQPRIARVPGRAIYSLDGRDTIKFLQGLITNNVESLSSNNPLYCAFLNPQGRMLSTAFIYLLNRESDQSASVLVDVDASVSANLLSFVKRFKLRSKVTIKDVSDEFQVWATWGKVPERNQSEIESNNVFVASGHDTRTPHMGRRMILKKEHQGGKDTADSAMMQLCQVDSVSSPESYTIHRILQGVADGANDVWENQSLPLEANVDYMNGIDYRKGCYVGQELTARTYHTGVVRKRIIPVSFYPASSPPPEALQVDLECSLSLPEKGADVRSIPIGDESARGKSAGKFLSGSNNIGLALLRLEQVHRWNEDLLIKVKTSGDDAQDLNIRPWIPSWWPEEGKKRPE